MKRMQFSTERFWAMVVKEFIQMRRDRLTFAMMIGIPLMQLLLFAFAINSDPKHLPTAVIVADEGPQVRTLLKALENSAYFDIVKQVRTEEEGRGILRRGDLQFDIRVHALYNPEAITSFNIVPGLMGVVLTMTMVMITGLAITRERESGTMENLLSMPTRPFEVMIGKIVPYIFVGYIQIVLILLAARFLFHVPMLGSISLLLVVALVFIAANLSVGITFSTVAQNQRQAMQMSFFFFLPSMLLSGFMFPFRGMPEWAQVIGEILPLTHFLRIFRGILLKGNGFFDIAPQLWPVALFTAVVLTVGVKRYRQTLD